MRRSLRQRAEAVAEAIERSGRSAQIELVCTLICAVDGSVVSALVEGALLLGSRLGPARTAAICAVSPALWLSAGSVAPGSFDGPDDWSANSVFGLPALGSIPIRVDCGNSDPFYAATKQFVAQLPHPPAGGFSPGGHNGGFWSAQLPAELTWFAPLLTG